MEPYISELEGFYAFCIPGQRNAGRETSNAVEEEIVRRVRICRAQRMAMLDPDSPLRLLENAALRTDTESTKTALMECLHQYRATLRTSNALVERPAKSSSDHPIHMSRRHRRRRDEVALVTKVFNSCYAAYRERELPAEICRDKCCRKLI
ncbi:hypothetical protein QCA50_014953 [Cerrena zonata]|uniref:Transposase n=1 Tax=Cerrena zonata TaxID=2478898 RepID=A0AAW0FQZ1_9APHY